jgi:1-deoxy-D-xylulose-5-phosphate reductoisomerase
MKNIFILGSTGSIGTNTLEVIRRFKDKFSVYALSANRNIELLEKQIEEFNPKVVVVNDEAEAAKLSRKLKGKCELLAGENGFVEATRDGDYDTVISSLVGFAGLAPTIEAIKRGKRIALANKETLVVAGEIIEMLSEKFGAEIIPVDSEHSAIFQSIVGEQPEHIRKILLTASGGPFFDKSKEYLKTVTVEQALNHPNWEMGNKVTIDSASMMNKGLEVIEARWLFKQPLEKIEVVIHPQSIVHSMVEFIDGSIKAQLSSPDMKIPIQYALTYPSRLESEFVSTEFPEIHTLTFYKPDLEKFENLKLAFEVLKSGGNAPCILNAANEIAVEAFLEGKISFMGMSEIVKEALNKISFESSITLDSIFECNRRTRDFVESLIKKENN